MTRIDELDEGFREAYLDYETLTEQLKKWADAYPELVRLDSIGKSGEGRELWVLTVGPDRDRVRPAVWIDGNMHASEVCGSSVALAIAEDVLRLHLGENRNDLPEPVQRVLRDVLFHIMPRMSPDGAEIVLTEGRFVRSVPRHHGPERNRPRWTPGDVDGDGQARLMRQQDPTGEFAESQKVAGVLVPRQIDDAGPFYKCYPEGTIEGFDGTIPTPDFKTENPIDLNRNFPWSWAPEHEQAGAGDFAASEPESRAVVEFATAHPNLFAWLNLHTFGGVFIRPLGHAPDHEMDAFDLAVFKQVEKWCDEHAGYPTVSGHDEFLYEPGKPLHGDLSDYGYHQRGCIAYVCELWDFFEQLGFPKKKKFIDRYFEIEREDIERVAEWDKAENAGRIFQPWRPFEHEQIGAVEIGGFDPRIGIWNPPYDRLAEICSRQSAAFLRVAALAPRLEIALTVTKLGDDVSRVEMTVHNTGYLPTFVLASAQELVWNEPVIAEARTDGCTLSDPDDARRDLGHLEGWGRGQHGQLGVLGMPRSRGSVSTRRSSWHVRGQGTVAVRAGSCRVGHVMAEIEVR